MDFANVAKRLQIGTQESWHKTREMAQRLGRTGKAMENKPHLRKSSLLVGPFL